MKYSFSLRLKIQEEKWIVMGDKHIITWEIRDLITASSGWFIIHQGSKKFASELIPILQKGIFELTELRQKYNIYEALHGLGTIESVIKFYKELLVDCLQYPYTELYGCVTS